MVLLDQLKIGLETLSRLESEYFSRPTDEVQAACPANQPYDASNLPLRDLISEMGSLPPCSMVIGACEDHSHLFLDLTDPQPGAILIVGDAGSGQTNLLHAMLASLTTLNSPRHLRYSLICEMDAEIQAIIEQPHCYRHHWPNSTKACDLMVEMADLIEKRQNSPKDSSAVVLAIDDLANFISFMDDATIEQLNWLVSNGPAVRIWTIATLNTEDMGKLNESFLDAFGTRLMGKIEDAEQAKQISGSETTRAHSLQAGKQFGVVFGEEWIPFWVPETNFNLKENAYGYRNAVVR